MMIDTNAGEVNILRFYRPFYSTLILPYTRRELPGWGKLMAAFGAYREDAWSHEPPRQVRGKLHSYLMTLDVSDRLDRTAYFLGRFYELATQMLMLECVRPRDTFVDIGANIGMITLLAARLVGSRGRVMAFEPNPDMYDRLSQNIQQNGLENVSLYPVGLGDAEASLPLRVWAKNKGWGTFGTLSSDELRQVTSQYDCRIAKGDDVLDFPDGVPLVMKIDVEGYECHVLRGLQRTLSRHRPIVITELIESNLRRAGSSPGDLFDAMCAHGYQAFGVDTVKRLLKHHLSLRPLSREYQHGDASNIVWLHPDCGHSKRISPKVFRG